MSQLPRHLPIEKTAINRIKETPQVVQWLSSFMRQSDSLYETFYDWTNNITFANGIELLAPGNALGENDNWRIVIVGDDLQFQKKKDVLGVSTWVQALKIKGA